jgi:hypothetical protein
VYFMSIGRSTNRRIRVTRPNVMATSAKKAATGPPTPGMVTPRFTL